MPLDKTKIAKLHQTMADNGADVGDINEFTKWFSGNDHYENRYRVYKLFKDNGADVGKDYNEFMSWVKQPEKQSPTIYQKAKQITQGAKQMTSTGKVPSRQQPWSYQAAKAKPTQKSTPISKQEPVDYISRPEMTQQDILSGQALRNTVEKRRETIAQVPQKGVEQIKQETARKQQPIVKTDTPADQYIVKTQGQWEDDVQRSVDDLLNEPVANDVNNAIASADEAYMGSLRANQQIGVPSEAAPIWGLMTEGAANRQRDPEKVLSGIVADAQQRYQEYFSQPETLQKIEKQSAYLGMTPDDYVNKVVLPQIEGKLKDQFDRTQIARNMPSGHVDYLLRGLSDSIVGTLASQLTTTKSQRQYAQMADEQFRQQRGGGFMSGVEDAARMGVSLAADASLLKGFGTAAGLTTKALAGTKYGAKILGDMGLRSAARYANASIAQRALMNIPSSVLSGAINLGLYEGTSNVVNNYSVGEDTSLGNTLSLFGEGFAHGGVTGGVLGLFGAATKGLGSNIGIKAGDKGLQKVVHGAEKGLYNIGALGVEGMGFHTADQINKFLSGEETDKNFGEFVTGTLDGAIMAGVLKLTSAHNAENAMRGIIRREPITQFKDGLAKFFSSENSDLRLTDADRKSLSFLGDIDKVIKNVNTPDDAAGIYRQVMENPKVPFSTKQKFSAMTVGTMSASKPIWNALYLLEDNTVETVKRTIDEQGNVHEQVIDRFEFKDKDDYKAKLQELNDERENQIMRNGYALHTQMLATKLPGLMEKVLSKYPDFDPSKGIDDPINRRIIEQIQNSPDSQQAFNDALNELVSQGVKIEDPLLKSFAQEYGLSEEDVVKVINKDFRDYTPAEAEMMKDFSNRIWDDLYPPNEAHPIQSMERGQVLADQAEIGRVVNTDAVQQLSEKYAAARQSYEAYLDSLNIKPEDMAGMSYPEQIDYILKNFGRDDAKDAILPLWDAELQNQGFFERLQQRTEEAADSVVSEMEFKGSIGGEKEEGMVYTIKDGDGREYILKGGDPVFTEGGRLDPNKTAGVIIALDENGHPVSIGVSDEITLVSKETKDERRARVLDGIQTQATEEYLRNGGLGDIVGQKLNVNPANAPKQENVQPPLKPESENVGGETGAKVNTEADKSTTTPAIPVAKNGHTKEYHKVDYDTAIEDILQRDNSKVSWNNDPAKVADSYLKAAEKSLDELEKKNKSLTKRAKEEDYTPDELDDITNGTENTEMGKYFAKKAEIEEKVKYYENLKERWNQRKAEEAPVENVSVQPAPVTEESASTREEIVREKNTLKGKWNALHRLYDGTVADDGEILDETRPLDVSELVAMNMPRGIAWNSYVVDGTHKVRGLSEELGYDKKRKIGKDTNTSAFNTFLAKKNSGIGIDTVVHRIWESEENSLPNGEKRFTDQEIRDAVIDMFLSAERPSDITNYVVNNRSRLANEKVEQARRYEEEMQRQYEEEQKVDKTQQRDEYLEPRNDKEKEIIAEVEKKLAEDIKEAEEEVRKAKSALEKAQVKESDKATDVFGSDNAFNEEGQIFDNSEMPVDQTIEGVERRTEAERERLMEAEAKLENLQSKAEHDSRVRGALDNERRQTTIEETPSEEGKSAGSIQSDMPFAPAEDDYVPFQKVEEFKPIGKSFFGNVYDQFKGRVKEAFNFLLKNREGDLLSVFHRSDIGDIDLIWGKHENHEGLEHMIMDHVVNARDFDSVEELMNVLDDVIKNGKVIKRNSKDKAQIMKDGYLVAVRKQHRNQKGEVDFKKNWVITAFDTNRKEHEKKRPESEAKELRKQIFGDEKETSPKGTLTTPPLNPEADGVTLPSSDVSSESKDSKKDDTLQENQQKVEKINTSDPMEAINQAANSFKESRLSKIEKTIRDGVVKLMKKAGIGVSTDWKEGQKIIDRHNSRVKTQKGNGPIFTSNAGRALESIKQEKATPEQWLKMIEKNGGLKAGEDKWMGLSEWLKGQDKKSLTKQEVMDYIRENSIQIEETKYQESIDIDNNPQMKEFRSEFENLTKKLEDEKEAVEQEANAFNDEMYQKYGEGWANDPDRLSEEDQRRNDEMIERWQKLNDEDTRELAFREMVEKYGDDFEMAFEYNSGNGKLEPQMDMYGDNISDAAKHFLQLEEQPINSTRLSYTTEGLDNKKEIALTVPTVESWNEGDEIHFGDAGNGRAVAWVRFGETTIEAPAEGLDKSKYTAKQSKQGGFDVYRPNGSEWGRIGAATAEQAIDEAYQDDVLRNKTMQRVLVIDEIQSKRHQEGREHGYKDESKVDNLKQEYKEAQNALREAYNKAYKFVDKDGNLMDDAEGYDDAMQEIDNASKRMRELEEELRLARRSYDNGIPDAPFQKNWHELAMKRMLRYAAENGYDKIAWTKGEQQAERYNIGEVVDKVISYDYPAVKDPDGRQTKKIEVRLKDGETMTMRVNEDGKVIEGRWDTKDKQLSEVVGKDLARSIMNGEGKDGSIFDADRDIPAKIIEGEGLRIGGEGMKGFYDQMLPRFMDKYGKRWGIKTGEIELPNVEEAGREMWSIDVTPEMRESVMQGQPMFQKDVNDGLTDTIFDQSKKLFGTTNDVRESGYVLPDGSMLDFSGRHLLDEGSDSSFLRGRRTTDHREIQSIAYERDGDTETGIETDMPDFIRRGGIRIDDNAGTINLSTKPTEQQKKVLKKVIQDNDGYVQIDFGDGWNSEHYVEYEGSKSSKILSDIDKYFDEGIKPQGDIRYFRTKDGEAYGFVKDGKIYIDPRIATSETPIHEYTHLWGEGVRRADPEKWKNIVDVLKNDEAVKSVWEKVAKEYSELKEDNAIAEEVLAQYSGKRGAERLRAEAAKIAKEQGEVEGVKFFIKLKTALTEFWRSVAEKFGMPFKTADDIADKVMKDLLEGKNPNEWKEKSLMGVHNISEEKLKKALKQGGLANPSMAVVDTNNGIHTDYGEISLIPKSSLIDSRTGRNAGTYAGDAYTPTYPYVRRTATKKGEKSIARIAKKVAGGDEELERHLRNNLFDHAEGNASRLHLLYLIQKGLNPEIKMERTTHSKDEFDAITKIFGEPKSTMPSDITKEQSDAMVDLMVGLYEKQIRENAKKVKDKEKIEGYIKDRVDGYRKRITDDNGKIWFADGDSFVYENWRDEQRRQKPQVDWYGTDNEASYRVAKEGLSEDYEKWKEEQLFGDGDMEEKLFAGYDQEGNKKYLPNTVKNASRLMNREADTNAYDQHGLNATKSSLLRRMKTLSDIRKSKHLLQGKEAYDKTQEEMSDELFDIIKQLSDMQRISDNPFSNNDYAEARLQEAITERDPIEYLNKEYGYNLDKDGELASQIMNFIEEAKGMPAKYFETKFKRPVGLDEFAVAVVPSTTSPEVIKALEDTGLEVKTYEKGNHGDENDQARTKATMDAIRDRDDIMFQRVGEKETSSMDEAGNSNVAEEISADPMKAIEKSAAMFREEQKDSVRYKEETEKNQPVENRAVVEGHVNTLKATLGEKIQTANSIDEIQNEKVRKDIESGKKVMGWYDTKTDSVHLYMPNISNSYEAERTVWHETVGHKGMRQLLGEEGYKKYMMKLWMDEKNAELSKFVKERLVENGYNPYEAIDEWLSQKAEGEVKNPYENASMWQKVREALSENLRKAGYRMSPSIMDVKYMTWLSEQNRKGKVSDAKKRKMLEKLMNEKYDTNTFHNQLYRKPGESEFDAYYRIQTGNGNTPVSLLARAQYRDAIYRSSFAWDESHHDYMAAWREFQKAQAQGNPIPDHMNALMLENEMDSKIKTAGDVYVRDYALPAQEAMNECLAKLNVDSPDEAYWQLNDYMYQKVGLQVNRQMYVRDWLRKQKANGNDVSKQEQEWYSLKADLKQKVDSGQITLRDYYQKTDEWIKKNISNKYVANEHDASGLTSFSGAPDGKTYDDGKILDNVMNMENLLGKQSAEKLWEQIKRITDFSLETEYAGGLVNKASIDAARSQYDWYIPLRGYDETTAEDMWSYLNRSGKEGLYAPTLAERKGRRSKAEDPIATAFMMGENAIRRAGRNQVKQAALRFARKFTDPIDKNSLITETDVWVHNIGTQQNPDWVVEYPNIKPDAKPHEVTQAVEQFNQQMAQLEKAGMAQKLKQAKGNIPYRFDNARNISEHIIEAKVNGESHLLVFNDNPRAAQAINGLLKPRATSEWMAKANRLMSQAYTSWAPTFIVRNAIRDAEFASSMLSVKEGWNYCGDFMNNYLKLTVPVAGGKKKPLMFDLFMKHRRGTLDDNNPIERMFKEFIENGGVTGYTQENNIEKWHDDLVKSFKNAGKKNAGKNAVKWFFEGVEKMNESVENAARFATYMTSRMGGDGHTPRTIIRAVADAKEVSVNFNRKGAGWKTATLKDENGKVSLNARTAAFTGQYLRDTALFYNATIQGIANSLGNARLATTKFATRFAIPPFVVGALIPLLNQWIHDTFDDDDGKTSDNPYADLPEWDRRSNLCIYLGNNNFFKIPLSLEHRAFYGIGDVAAGVIYDEKLKSIDKPPIVDAVKQLSTFSPVDYTDTEIGMEGPVGKIIGVLTPAVVKPWVQAANNTSWTGVPIQKENKFNGDKVPEYQKAYEGKTNQLFVDAANLWHQFWGGNDIERAGKNENLGTAVLGNELVEGIGEISPAKAQYLAEQVPGETGKLVTALASGAYNLGKGVATGQSVKDIFDLPDWNVKMIPGVKAFFSQGNEQSQFYRARTKAYRYLDEMRDVEYAEREYKKQSADNPAKKIEQQEFEKTKRYKQYEMYKKDYKKDLDKYYKEIKAEKDPKKRRDLKEEQNIKMKQFVDAMDNIE